MPKKRAALMLAGGTWALVFGLSLDIRGVPDQWALGIHRLPVEIVIGGLPSEKICMEGALAVANWVAATDGALKLRGGNCRQEEGPR